MKKLKKISLFIVIALTLTALIGVRVNDDSVRWDKNQVKIGYDINVVEFFGYPVYLSSVKTHIEAHKGGTPRKVMTRQEVSPSLSARNFALAKFSSLTVKNFQLANELEMLLKDSANSKLRLQLAKSCAKHAIALDEANVNRDALSLYALSKILATDDYPSWKDDLKQFLFQVRSEYFNDIVKIKEAAHYNNQNYILIEKDEDKNLYELAVVNVDAKNSREYQLARALFTHNQKVQGHGNYIYKTHTLRAIEAYNSISKKLDTVAKYQEDLVPQINYIARHLPTEIQSACKTLQASLDKAKTLDACKKAADVFCQTCVQYLKK